MGQQSLAEAKQLFEKFKAAFIRNDLSSCSQLLTSLKLKLTELPSLPPLFESTPNALEELLFAREVMEHGVVLSVRMKDDEAFERNFLQLKSYYTDTRHVLPPSAQEGPILGLNLLYLLVQNRIAAFHTELELLPPEALSHEAIRNAVQLEQSLMEGSFNRVLAARTSIPDPVFGHFLEQLIQTVRDEIADCSEKAYESLSVKEASRLLMLTSADELHDYATDHGWLIKDGTVHFQKEQHQAPHKEIPSMQLISQALGYARELERIV